MAFQLPDLPFSKDALAPHMSAETLEFHHGKHHAAYVKKTNEMIEGKGDLSGASLVEVVRALDAANVDTTDLHRREATLDDVFDLNATVANLDTVFSRLHRLVQKEEPVHA